MSKEELLAVLDMSKEEQRLWCVANTEPGSWAHLADLAFRLRDEVIKNNKTPAGQLYKATECVYVYLAENNILTPRIHSNPWWKYHAKPIHWIIAALIAKEKEDE